MGERSELVSGFRLWLDLPEAAPRDQLWAAREAYAALLEELMSGPEPVDLVGEVLAVARDEHERALVSEAVIAVVNDKRYPEFLTAIYERSDDEAWATLGRYIFDIEATGGLCSSNFSQVAVAYNWMGANWPGELAEGEFSNRYNDAAFTGVHALHDDADMDPMPLLAALVRACRTEADYFHIAAGPFEDVIRRAPAHRAAIEKMARTDREWADVLHGVWVDKKTADELSDFLRAAVIVLDD